jgi:AcrR family transcriptional regulator
VRTVATTTRELTSDKAQRIVDAMRASVGERGAAGSTFDHVARTAGVSRGLLHYYFGTKERLLVEVCRRDCDIRMGLLDEAFASSHDADELIAALVRSLEDMLRDDPGFIALIFELFTSSRHNEEIAAGLRELNARVLAHVAEQLAAKEADGAIRLGAEPEAVAGVLFALADGLAFRMLAGPDREWGPTVDAAALAVRQLILPV